MTAPAAALVALVIIAATVLVATGNLDGDAWVGLVSGLGIGAATGLSANSNSGPRRPLRSTRRP